MMKSWQRGRVTLVGAPRVGRAVWRKGVKVKGGIGVVSGWRIWSWKDGGGGCGVSRSAVAMAMDRRESTRDFEALLLGLCQTRESDIGFK